MKRSKVYLIIVFQILCVIFAAANIFSKELICQTYEDGAVPVGENKIDLGRGSYKVFIEYKTSTKHIFCQFAGKTIWGNESEDKVWLPPDRDTKEFELRLDKKMTGAFSLIKVFDESAENLVKVNKIVIRQTRQQEKVDLFLLCCLILAVDFCYVMYRKQVWKKIPEEKRWTLSALVSITVFSSVPLFLGYLLDGHDTGFHVRRIEELAQGLLAGQFPVRMEAGYLNDMGYPISIMYGDLLLYIPAFLRIIGIRAHTTLQIYLFLINFITAVSAYKCILTFTEKRVAALAGSAMYTLSIYHIANLYYRGAVGETTAMAFAPLVFAGLYGMFCKEKRYRKQAQGYLIIGYTGILQSHLLSFEMVIIFSALYLCFHLKEFFENFVPFIKTAAVTVLLNVSFLIPMMDYMLTQDFCIETQNDSLQNVGLFFSQVFLTQAAGTFADSGRVGMPLGIGYALVLVLAVWFAQAAAHGVDRGQWKIFALAVISIGMSSYIFPWQKISKIPLVGMYLTAFQFPWRFLWLATLFCSILGGYMLSNFEKLKKRNVGMIMAVLLAAISFLNGEQWMEKAIQGMTAMKVTSGSSLDSITSVGGGEYLLAGTTEDDFTYREAEAGDAVVIFSYEKEGISVRLACSNTSGEESSVKIPMFAYKGFVAVDEETGVYMKLENRENLLSVTLPAGYRGIVQVYFKEPVLWRICEGISMLTLIALVFYFRKKPDE